MEKTLTAFTRLVKNALISLSLGGRGEG